MNIINEFYTSFKDHPEILNKPAIIHKDKYVTFLELNRLINQYSRLFQKYVGMKALIFLRPSTHFSAVVFAAFKVGMIPIFIDPGMGLKNLLNAIKNVRPDVLIAEPVVYAIKFFNKDIFSSVKHCFINSHHYTKNIASLNDAFKLDDEDFETVNFSKHQLAAILFTSGGTGKPKGVEYTHHTFISETNYLRNLFSLTPSDIDIPGFPLFSLFAVAMGMTSCPPPMNPSKPAKANAKKLVAWIKKNKGTFLAGSPAIWKNVRDYCEANLITLDTVKYLVMFGAPIPKDLHLSFKKIIPNGKTFTPYGATEALPVACITGDEVLKTHELATCVGKIVEGLDCKIIQKSTDAIPDLREAKILNRHEIGEIIVSGPTVTERYYDESKATKRAKIFETLPSGKIKIWHRMGDMGYFDDDDNLWFCGRAAHSFKYGVNNYYSILCEAIANGHHEIFRTALINPLIDGKKIPAMVIERYDHKILKGIKKDKFFKEVLHLLESHHSTKDIKHLFQIKAMPVDVRHNIKIDRTLLSTMFSEVEE